jgi:hypothetical protein
MSNVKVDREAFARIVMQKLAWISGLLVAAGWPTFAAWWGALYERFLRSTCRQLVVRAGRRAGKSSWACVFAVAFALVYAGLGLVPPGDTGWCVFVSVSVAEAASRLRTIASIMDVLQVPYRTDGETLIIEGTNIGFRVVACSIASVSGWTSILVIADEVPKWRDGDGLNPAGEVLAALKPTMASQPLSLILLLGSPMGHGDPHAKAFDQGDNAFQMTAFATTWEANESIGEQETHDLEPDPRVHAREYGAKPQGDALGAFDERLLDVAHQDPGFDYVQVSATIGVIDSSDVDGNTNCEFAGGLACWVQKPWREEDVYVWRDILDPQTGRKIGRIPVRGPDGHFLQRENPIPPPMLLVHRVWGVRGEGISIDDIHDHIARECDMAGARIVTGDQYGVFGNVGGLARRGIEFVKRPWNATNKMAAVSFLRRLMASNPCRLILDPWATDGDWAVLRKQLAGFREHVENGSLHYRARSGLLSDRASLLLVAALASMSSGNGEPSLFGPNDPLGPTGPSRGASEVPLSVHGRAGPNLGKGWRPPYEGSSAR